LHDLDDLAIERGPGTHLKHHRLGDAALTCDRSAETTTVSPLSARARSAF
jgi:hypothetical protein